MNQKTLRRIYERHLEGQPVTAAEAAQSAAHLAAWLDQWVRRHPDVVAGQSQCATLLEQIAMDLNEALLGNDPKRSRGPR